MVLYTNSDYRLQEYNSLGRYCVYIYIYIYIYVLHMYICRYVHALMVNNYFYNYIIVATSNSPTLLDIDI